jgi:hypothetical protein
VLSNHHHSDILLRVLRPKWTCGSWAGGNAGSSTPYSVYTTFCVRCRLPGEPPSDPYAIRKVAHAASSPSPSDPALRASRRCWCGLAGIACLSGLRGVLRGSSAAGVAREYPSAAVPETPSSPSRLAGLFVEAIHARPIRPAYRLPTMLQHLTNRNATDVFLCFLLLSALAPTHVLRAQQVPPYQHVISLGVLAPKQDSVARLSTCLTTKRVDGARRCGSEVFRGVACGVVRLDLGRGRGGVLRVNWEVRQTVYLPACPPRQNGRRKPFCLGG